MNFHCQNGQNTQKIDIKSSDSGCILFFVRAPEKGKVKTRLACVIGEDAALKLYMSFVADELDMLRALFFDVIIFFHPRTAGQTIGKWLKTEFDFVAQSGQDLGQKMKNAFDVAFSRGYAKALLIGSDLPDLTSSVILDAFNHLTQKDTVIGPCEDGGYYLIGFRRDTYNKNVFTKISWGTSRVFNQTLLSFREKNLNYHILSKWHDIDNYKDLVRLKKFLNKNPTVAKHTYSCLMDLYHGSRPGPR